MVVVNAIKLVVRVVLYVVVWFLAVIVSAVNVDAVNVAHAVLKKILK